MDLSDTHEITPRRHFEFDAEKIEQLHKRIHENAQHLGDLPLALEDAKLPEFAESKDPWHQPKASELKAKGKELREKVPRSSHAELALENRLDPVEVLRGQEKSRVEELLPLRHTRMAATPFTFYRGAAAIMAGDLSRTPATGITVQACGDAHVSNFGLFESAERNLVFDINDFDETLPGPWEWDVKRLAASIEICGRDRGFGKDQREDAVFATVNAYRRAMRSFSKMGNLEVWYTYVDAEHMIAMESEHIPETSLAAIEKLFEKARAKNSSRAVRKLTERDAEGRLRIVSKPPEIVPMRELVDVPDSAGARTRIELGVKLLIRSYLASLPRERRRLVGQYSIMDAARKVVGVGSVGTRCWMLVLQGRDENDPLVLQIKEAESSVLEPYVGKSRCLQHGERVVTGQRAIQNSGDILLGWMRAPGEDNVMHDYYVRQLWDGKGSFDLEKLDASGLANLGRLCGWTLARSHARTGDRHEIAGYLGKSEAFDEAIVAFSRAYADLNDRDYDRFLKALSAKEIAGA
ncbi:MAG: DUF2252 domain-containing protein [Coriobacteriales bacterium]|jgi:uncharacterized protein (DUF2252 family)